MAIGQKLQTRADKQFQDLGRSDQPSGPRIYNDTELKSFHDKIQRFRVKKTLTSGEEIEVISWWEVGVAFGAFVKKMGSQNKPCYAAATNSSGETTRSAQYVNLWDQYEDWRKKQDWIAQQKVDSYELMAPSAI